MTQPFRRVTVLSGRYVDSIRLLSVSLGLEQLDGVTSASAVMSTGMNLELLRGAGFELPTVMADDLVVAIAAESSEALDSAFADLEELLADGSKAVRTGSRSQFHSTAQALDSQPECDVVVVAVPGRYAALEAWDALRAGKDVLIFSDNVPAEDEIALKWFASGIGRLVMGPDCGTAIINGIGLGFANRVRRGSVGLVGASGTGLQHVSSLVHAAGAGIAAAYGTGSHDLSSAVGGLTTLQALDRLERDPTVESIGLISKPADLTVALTVLDRLARTGKKAVACLIGVDVQHASVEVVPDLASAADALMGKHLPHPQQLPQVVVPVHVAGLFAGGTLCEEAGRVARAAGVDVSRFVDVGADEYTQGRAHPMIDPRLRASMIAEAGDWADVILFDVVLGDLAHENPAGALSDALADAKRRACARSCDLRLIASLIGTDLDPQDLNGQRRNLESQGVIVCDRNADAARLAVSLPAGASAR